MDGGEMNEDDEEDWSMPVEASDLKVSRPLLDRAKPHSTVSHPRVILHIDVDCFYAQVEMIHNPGLRDVPLGIQQKYLLVTCNYPARERGVTKLMGVVEAKKKCPDIVLVNGENLTRYREMSYKISEFLMKYTPNVERLGFDENYLDVTEMVEQRMQSPETSYDIVGHTFSPSDPQSTPPEPCPCGCHSRLAVGSQIAADIRSALKIELDITCCGGIGHNKLLAKLGGGQHKPNQQTTVHPQRAVGLLSALSSAHHIPGIGWTTRKRLQTLGVASVVDLQQFPHSRLEEEFGVAMAVTIQDLAFGIDPTPVVTYHRPQTLSVEDSFRRCSTVDDVKSRIVQLMSSLLPRAVEDGRRPFTLRVTVRKARKEDRYLHRESRQCNLPPNVWARASAGDLASAKDQLVPTAMSLFRKMVDTKKPFHLTLINIAFTRLEESASTANNIIDFFSRQSPEQSKMLENNTPESSGISESIASEKSGTSKNITPEKSGFFKSISPQKSGIMKNVTPQTCGKGDKHSLKRNSNSLLDIWSKKQKLSATSLGGNSSFQNEKPDSKQKNNGGSVEPPPGVDPEIFAQLPADIKREIIETAALSGEGDSSLGRASSCTEKGPHLTGQTADCHGEQCDVREKLLLHQRKPIFSPKEVAEMVCDEQSEHTLKERSDVKNAPDHDMTNSCIADSDDSEGSKNQGLCINVRESNSCCSPPTDKHWQEHNLECRDTATAFLHSQSAADKLEDVNPRKTVDKPSSATSVTCSVLDKPSSSTSVTNYVLDKPSTSTSVTNSVLDYPSSSTSVTNSVLDKPSSSTSVTNSVLDKPSSSTSVTNSVLDKPSSSTSVTNSVLDKPSSSTSVTKSGVDKPTGLEPKLCEPKTSLPKGVDPDVFSALPVDIQREILAQQAVTQTLSPTASNRQTQQGKAVLRKPSPKQNSLFNYMKKR